MTLPHIPVKQLGTVVRNREVAGKPHEVCMYVATVDGVEIGDFKDSELAVMEADWCAYYQVFSDQLLRYGLAFDQESITLAIKLFKVFFRGETVRKSGESAVEAYLSHEEFHTAFPASLEEVEAAKWFITEDGTLNIKPTPKKRKGEEIPTEAGPPYLITHEQAQQQDAAAEEPGRFRWQVQETCTCPDVVNRAWKHSGMCKHVALRTILMMAQYGREYLESVVAALRAGAGQPAQQQTLPLSLPDPEPTPAPAPAPQAAPVALAVSPAPVEEAPPAPSEPAPATLPEIYIDLPARHLASAVLFIRTVSEGMGATVLLINGLIALSLNDGETTANLSGLAGQGCCEHKLSGPDVEALWLRAQALSKAIKDEPVRLIVGETVTIEPVNPIAEAVLLKAA